MELEIKCLECGKRTRRFEIGPAAYVMKGDMGILLRDTITCPKCKKDISNDKCVTPKGMFMISLMALTVGMIGEKEEKFQLPPHLMDLAIVTQENYDTLKKQSKASIKLVNKLRGLS